MWLCVDLEQHLEFTAYCNQTLQAMFDLVKFSDYLPLNSNIFELFFFYACQVFSDIRSKSLYYHYSRVALWKILKKSQAS